MRMCKHIYNYIHACLCVCDIHTCMCVCVDMYDCMYMHIHMYWWAVPLTTEYTWGLFTQSTGSTDQEPGNSDGVLRCGLL